jgi:D-glycero-D-manno-heptose 1,7-bisphosphate phosphatase
MALAPALFLDRDGNLIEDHHHTCEVHQISPISGVKPALEACLQAGYRLFILTNQSGINRGKFTWSQYHACNRRMLELLALPTPGILEIKAAPERPDEPSVYRKPSPQFILEMIAKYQLDHAAAPVAPRTSPTLSPKASRSAPTSRNSSGSI